MEHIIKVRFGDNSDRLVPKLVPASEQGFEKTVEEIFRSMNPIFTLSERIWKPQMDIYETPEDIFILAEIAGVSKEDLEIEINAKAVRIYGKRSEAPVGKGTYRLAEIQYGQFERILFLPAPIDTEKVTASFINGFLKIRMTKLRHKPRKIPISD